ncbi:MAG TPA: quinone-dependent dihydroorotate dehydrogenase [Campylobacterales bacterium]|nr:quinone-dependent dihydroorotate dehydrogenase [Campylobacterales bacterium]
MLDYYDIRKLIFLLDPEDAHNIVENLSKLIQKSPFLLETLKKRYFVDDKRLSQQIFGKTFQNPVGLAAGFDKNATMIKTMAAVGFGFVEIGTITPKPQSGNPKPRIFRYPELESIQNSMGFNNDGMEKIAKRIKDIYPFDIPIGINIGKNKTTPQEDAIKDYKVLIEKFKDICDYMVINISSPNTPNLRDLQNENFIKDIFLVAKEVTDRPVLLKIAPDMSCQQAVDLACLAVDNKADGIIATNTTTDYSLIKDSKKFGGISGKVLKKKSFEIFKAISKELFGKTILISVGGIDTPLEAYKRIKAGASLIELFSGLIFKGPFLVKNINIGILRLLERDGFKDIKEAIGADLK